MNDDKLIQIEQALYTLADELEARYPIYLTIVDYRQHWDRQKEIRQEHTEYFDQAGRLLIDAFDLGGLSPRLRNFIGTYRAKLTKYNELRGFYFRWFGRKLIWNPNGDARRDADVLRYFAAQVRSKPVDKTALYEQIKQRRDRYRLPEAERIGYSAESERYEYHSWKAALKTPERVERLLLRRRGNPPINAEIARFRNLHFLLGHVDKRLPDEIGDLTELRRLVVRGRDFVLPDSISKLTKLEVLLLSCDDAKMLPEALTQLPNLRELSVSGKLEALPVSIGDLKSLKILTLGYNRLKELPESFAHLHNLVRLDISGNEFERFPGDILAELPRLEILTWGKYTKNPLPFPDDLLRLKALRRLHFRGKTTKEEIELLKALRPNLDIRTW